MLEEGDDFGFVPDGADEDFGFVPDEPKGATVPTGFHETGARVLELPETTIVGDPTGQGRGEVIAGTGPATEYRITDKPDFDNRGTFERLTDWASGALQRDTRPYTDPERLAERRAELMGAAQGLTLEHGDEIGAGVASLFGADYEGTRDRIRQSFDEAREAHPGSFMSGEVAGSLPYMAIPGGGATRLSRILQQMGIGAGLGTVAGAGASEGADATAVASDAARGGAWGGAVGGAMTGLAELPGALSGLAHAAERSARQSRLEATGIWGGRAMRAADEMRGGQEALASDLRRLGIGHGISQGDGRPSLIARPERSLDDAAEVLSDAGGSMGDVLDRMDAAAGQPRSPLASIEAAPSRSLETHRLAFEGLSPEEATAVATGQRPPAAGARRWEPIDVIDEREFRAGPRGAPYRESRDGTSGYVLQDGNHRLAAAREAGAKQISARVRTYGADGEVVSDVTQPIAIDAVQDAASRGLVDLGRVAEEMDRVAAEYARLPVGGRQIAGNLQSQIIEPMREMGSVSFREAHQQRQLLDDMIRSWSRDPNLATTAGRLQTARRAISRAMDEAAEALDPAILEQWKRANRDYSVASFVRDYGRGAERLSVGGGIGGATGTAIENTLGHVPVAGAYVQRELAQQTRMTWPGIRTLMLEAIAPRLARMGPQGQRWARMLEAGGQRGGVAGLAAAHYVLSQQDPDYRAAVEAARREQDGADTSAADDEEN